MRIRIGSGRRRLSIVWRLFEFALGWMRLRAHAGRRREHSRQTRGSGLALTEFLRDRLRPRWLRLRHDESDDGSRS